MLYASLVGPLLGVYYPLPTSDPTVARKLLNSSRLKSIWCSIYTGEEVASRVDRFNGQAILLPDHYAWKLDYKFSDLSPNERATLLVQEITY